MADTELQELIIWNGTQEQYDALETKDPNTIYMVDNKIPPLPTDDGTYVLSATITAGVVTFAWVLKS